jgi:hypothetical protein
MLDATAVGKWKCWTQPMWGDGHVRYNGCGQVYLFFSIPVERPICTDGHLLARMSVARNICEWREGLPPSLLARVVFPLIYSGLKHKRGRYCVGQGRASLGLIVTKHVRQRPRVIPSSIVVLHQSSRVSMP